MKKNVYIICFFVAAATLVISYFIGYNFSLENDDIIRKEDVKNEAGASVYPEEETTKEPVFLITEHDGYVTVYENDKGNLYLNTSIKADSLSTDERSALQSGIMIDNIQEMYNCLESYTS